MESQLIKTLREAYVSNADYEQAESVIKYLKNNFGSFGIKHGPRRVIDKSVAVDFQPLTASDYKELFGQTEREFHHFAVEALLKDKKNWNENTLDLIEWLITHQSWWDTVDSLATHHCYLFFKKHPELEKKTISRWNKSDNMWLNRTSIIYQIKRKSETDLNTLAACIVPHLGSKEFFIRKAIGWSLRELGTYQPEWVIDFCDNHEMSGLSRREALRKLI